MYTYIYIYIYMITGLKISVYLTKNMLKNKSNKRILKKIQILQFMSCLNKIEKKPEYLDLRVTDECTDIKNDYCLPSMNIKTVYDDKKAVLFDWKVLPKTAPNMFTESSIR
jgi:hypothetical protein